MGIAERIQELMKAAGTNPKRLSRKAGLNENAVRDIIKGRSKNPRQDTVVKLARALGEPVSALLDVGTNGDVGRAHAPVQSESHGTAVPADEPPEMLGEDVPVLGYGRGGEDGFFLDSGAVIDRVERPGSLRNVRDAYAVYMHGTSQEPRIRHGELCYVDPSRPPGPGDDVVVQLEDDAGYIKTYVRRTAKEFTCSQYNPPQEITWPSDDVRAVHRIVWIARTVR